MYFVRRMDHMQVGAVNKIIGRILVPRMERHIPILCPMGPREEGGERRPSWGTDKGPGKTLRRSNYCRLEHVIGIDRSIRSFRTNNHDPGRIKAVIY